MKVDLGAIENLEDVLFVFGLIDEETWINLEFSEKLIYYWRFRDAE